MSFQVPDSTLIEDEYNYDYDDIWDEYPDEDGAAIVPTSDIKRINFYLLPSKQKKTCEFFG